MPSAELPGEGSHLVAWIDVTAGVAGDMLLAALVDAGADLGAVQQMVDRVMPATVRLSVVAVTRAGVRATKLEVRSLVSDQEHRAWRVIRAMLADADIPTPVRETAGEVFARLAAVEGRVHSTEVDDVEFHEVGSWDSIADIVGCCAAMHHLGVSEVITSPVAVGSGTVRAAHGVLSVPVPAVLGLLEGWSVLPGGDGERATPTGVALVTTLARSQSGIPAMHVAATGVGAGTRDTPDRPNVVRVVLGRSVDGVVAAPAKPDPLAQVHHQMTILEANVDDLDPRVWPTVLAELLDAGAADVWVTPIVMKKGRPAHTVTVLSAVDQAAALGRCLIDLTSTLGVRQHLVDRWSLARGWTNVTVGDAPVAVKVGHHDGRIVHATPEFEDLVAVAAATGRPVRDVLAAASAAAAAAGLARGSAVPADLRQTRS